jgi:hypothetical protein
MSKGRPRKFSLSTAPVFYNFIKINRLQTIFLRKRVRICGENAVKMRICLQFMLRGQRKARPLGPGFLFCLFPVSQIRRNDLQNA